MASDWQCGMRFRGTGWFMPANLRRSGRARQSGEI
jgi:hypothetical protein